MLFRGILPFLNLASHGLSYYIGILTSSFLLQERKRETWTHRRLENLKDVTNYFNMVKANKELEHGKHFFLPTGLAAFTPLIVKVGSR